MQYGSKGLGVYCETTAGIVLNNMVDVNYVLMKLLIFSRYMKRAWWRNDLKQYTKILTAFVRTDESSQKVPAINKKHCILTLVF